MSDMRILHYMIKNNGQIFYIRIFVIDKFHRYISGIRILLSSEIFLYVSGRL